MSYLVLARKYRPMFFEQVVGQQHVTKTLQNAIQQNRIANAYLFSGPRGVGKTTVARILAKALNCEKGPTITPCDKCSYCVEINESRSLDVFEIDGASNRGIDEVRNLRDSLRYSPNPGKHRIYIIDEVHMLTNEAFNALLKTLEEPPKNVLFIFATTESHKVPATILSRCQRFDFKRITNKKISEQLKMLCEKEEIQIDEESLRHITNKGDGSMRDSESILDQIIAYAGKTVTAGDVESLLGIINQDLFFQVTDYIINGDVKGGIDLSGQIFIEGYDFSEFLTGLSEHFRNILVVKTTKAISELDVSEEVAQRYLSLCDAFEVEDLLRLIKISSDTEYIVRRSSSARLHLEMALVKMINMNKSVMLSQLLQNVELKKKADTPTRVNDYPTASFSTFKPQTAPPKTNGYPKKITNSQPDQEIEENEELQNDFNAKEETDHQPTLDEIEENWERIIENVKSKKIAVGSCLAEGWPVSINGKLVEISFDPQNSFQMSNVERNRKDVQEIMAAILHCPIRIKCVRDEKGALKNVKKVAVAYDKKSQFNQLVTENKVIKNIVDTFDTELIE
ncbi:DNA polymerase III subunit gamma/tau [candidate division KSB1 bacterium]|nr:DNA polymerase III subunit gamma/tau [candidate division KSB1 bacterium]